MKCSCCGKDILPYERYCNHCGENNENYIDGYQEPVLTSDKTVSQTIERVQIYPNQLPKEDKEQVASKEFNTVTNNENYKYKSRTQTSYQVDEPTISLAIWALVLTQFMMVVSLIFAIIGLKQYKTKPGKILCKIALIIDVVGILIVFLIVFIELIVLYNL